MSMHAEWDVATTVAIDVASRDEANDDWDLNEEVTMPYVLAIGGDGGGCIAIEGTREDLVKFSERLTKAINNI